MSVVTIERKVLEKNDAIAAANRDAFARHGLFVFNLVSSPGAGKTSLLERDDRAPARHRCASASSKATCRPISTPSAWRATACRSCRS